MLADRHGNVIHLGERDCSIQRRHQKVIEESPAPEWVVDPQIRERIGKIGVDAAKAVDYVGAGTIEGLFATHQDEPGEPEYFFLEMNTRVQVEHCVTEMTTGIDIVKEGIRAAAGEELAYAQEDVELRGHAIECRINAEDASKNFAPAPGRIGRYREPSGPGVRVDSGVAEDGEVSPMYDPMVAKLIVWDADREQATQRMLRALGEYEIEGLKTLIPFHQALLATEDWKRGETCKDLLEDKAWLKTLAFPKDAKPAEGEDAEKVEQTYEVEVSGKRFDVRVVGPPFAGRRRRRLQRRGARRARRRNAASARRAAGGGPDTLEAPLQGNMWKVLVKAGRRGHGGPAALHHRGDEDGERDHRPQGGHDRRAADRGGRADPGRRADRDDHERARASRRSCATLRAWIARISRERRPSGSSASRAPLARARAGRRVLVEQDLGARGVEHRAVARGRRARRRASSGRRRSSVARYASMSPPSLSIGISIAER